MNYWIFFAVTIAIAFAIAWEDFKSREVSWIFFPLLAFAGIFISLSSSLKMKQIVTACSINASFLLLQWLLLKLYFKLRSGSARLLNEKLGPGDILFMLAACFFFQPVTFIVFYLSSLLLAIVLSAPRLFIKNNVKRQQTIPLAGLQAIGLVFFLLIERVLNLSFIAEGLH